MIALSHSFHGQLQLPHYVYHGTLKNYINSFRDRVLDASWWSKIDRDFGCAFYTTISLKQAKEWAVRMAKKSDDFDAEPAVIKIRISPEIFAGFPNCLVFLGDNNPEWTKFIVDHRLDCDASGHDPCGHAKHPAIIVGQMADNKMDFVHAEFNKLSLPVPNKYEWYYDKIIQDQTGKQLDALELGNQIAFADPGLNEMLKLERYYLYDETGKEWIDHDRNVDPV